MLIDRFNTPLFYNILVLIFCQSVVAQPVTNDQHRRDYIKKYSSLAIKEMEKSGIPASITLAQGILESGSGRSSLAIKAKNHFGIKCHAGWDGLTFLFDDDRLNDCFRVYESVDESFVDHTIFLTSRERYASLFSNDRSDYKAWARGLKRAGYATDGDYDKNLIRIIEENKLYLFDSGQIDIGIAAQEEEVGEIIVSRSNIINVFGREILLKNRIKYVKAKKGESFLRITDELDLLSWQLKSYNELSDAENLKEGEIIYIQPKRRRADPRFRQHIVQENETMYIISQEYGIKLKRLYELNRMIYGSWPLIGQKINLRKKIKINKNQQAQ